MTENRILVVCSENSALNADFNNALTPYGFKMTFVEGSMAMLDTVRKTVPQLIIVCVADTDPDFFSYLTALNWQIPVVMGLPATQITIDRRLLRAGVVDFVELPATPEAIVSTVHRVLKREASTLQHQQLVNDLEKANQTLQRRLHDFEVLLKIARSIGTLLESDAILNRITESAVFMTGAEEGYLLLMDDETGQLQLRAAQNLGEKQSRNFNISVIDSIAGTVLQSGKPVLLGGENTRLFKVKTGLLVKSLLNVPLTVRGRAIGVLGVDNQSAAKEFSPNHVHQLTHLANIAATTIENTNHYNETRAKLTRRVREFGLLQALTGQLGIITNFEVGAQMALSMLLKATGAEAGVLHWLNDVHRKPVSISQGVLGETLHEQLDYDDADNEWWSQEVMNQLLATGKPILDNNFSKTTGEHGSCLAVADRKSVV